MAKDPRPPKKPPAEAKKQYDICQQRGHVLAYIEEDGSQLWNVCKYCDTYFRAVQTFEEKHAP